VNPFLVETPARLAFSGGRTSGYLVRQVVDAFGGSLPDDVVVTFANTGREVPETLDFVRECGDRWKFRIRWVEYRRGPGPAVKPDCGQPKIGCHGFAEVDYATASRDGEPFAAIIDVKADFRAEAKGEPPVLPNPTDRWCSAELKARTMDRFMRSIGYDEWTAVVGIRADEAKRAVSLRRNDTAKVKYVCPLVDAGVTEADVLRFWKSQPFDLALPNHPTLGTYEGNCDGCFLKRRRSSTGLRSSVRKSSTGGPSKRSGRASGSGTTG
jgi:3'-phosphoadenosine 5'-phosphosulfate sulfotransferase (PAPS reductase)/FAD synthetase